MAVSRQLEKLHDTVGEQIRNAEPVPYKTYIRGGPTVAQRLRAALCWPAPFDVHAFLAREPLRDRVGKPVAYHAPPPIAAPIDDAASGGTGLHEGNGTTTAAAASPSSSALAPPARSSPLLSPGTDIPARDDDAIYGFYFYTRTEGSQAFGPDFQQTYLKLRDKGAPLEVIFCSLDEAYIDYTLTSCATPHWIKFAHNDARVMELAEACDVSAGPALVMVEGRTGTVLAKDAAPAAMADPEGHQFPWRGAHRPLYQRHPLSFAAAVAGVLAMPRLYWRWIK